MKRVQALILLWVGSACACGTPCNQGAQVNVNSRYTIESVEVSPEGESQLSVSLREDLNRLIGEKLNPRLLDDLARRIRQELKAGFVAHKLTRGSLPDTVKVIFHFERRRNRAEIVAPRLVYHSRQNWTFGLDGTWKGNGHNVRFGVLTDGDELMERYSGIRGGFERTGLAAEHLSLKFDLESWRAQWNPATQLALEGEPQIPGIYRTRFDFHPSANIVIAKPLTLSVGLSFQRFETQFPAARSEGAHAVVNTLRFARRWETLPTRTHELNAGYSLRAATKALDSDFVYTRHSWDAAYTLSGYKESVMVGFTAGVVYGRAPLFERFALGNSRTLRGWNKFDVDPLGADRMAHGSIEYRNRGLRIVFDTGAGWRRGGDRKVRHSAGVGFIKDGITALIAFPLKEGGVEPIFITGINF